MQHVPLIDLTAFYHQDWNSADSKQLLCQLDEALTNIGFLCVKGTQVETPTIERAQRLAMEFFDLSQEEKNRVKALKYPNRGYTGLAELGLSYSMDADDLKTSRTSPPDLFERYRIGPVDNYADKRAEPFQATAYAPNVWPASPVGFEQIMTAYYHQMNGLSQDLLRLFARALGLSENWFSDKVDRSMASLAINNYPAQFSPPLAGQLRAGPHTDYGTLTIVAPTAAPGGLQIRTRNGQWEDVHVEPGTFVVNIGDMMAQWSNDRWVSTVHRVANPPESEGPTARRLSMVFFHQPNPDAFIECIPTCIRSDMPAKYLPVIAGEYINAKINRHFKSYLAG